ncbi:HTH-type transcriptional regulator DegA [Dickeya dianthicola]|uniref:LacI family transcriptional regulator n=1 Tax=Dickeya dianthicola TaxID=204039 RepID=A0AAP6VGH0_9GAMM|nr:LacI family DNA-binding transcriptional regulator [Dickeya dianthicola]AYC19120.1 HTH-type transcriptional regulator DegA [Dickeya dianthicola]MBI0440244.1 LacI family transcriptional regulator [Dickeya dianthicola]MBI0451305.1 LacI family transcriptional regulator [Dickeya dianthicola]MBI0455723.1 LacI family transcriptional regulator [Dickeya dianthicola]MBI0460164.1 LacI family transcriptional regulator [Dickeya dianthicola]
MASIRDVAIKAGVSTATVSRVINNHPSVTAETRRTVHEAMDFLCYVPNRNAVQLSGKCSGLIGVIVPNLVNPHFCELLATLEEEARYVGKTILVKTHQNQPFQDRKLVRALAGMGIEALIWVPTEVESSLSGWLQATGIKTAVVTQTSRFFNSVSNNQERGAEAIAEHFIDTGRTRFGVIGQDGVDNRKMSAFCKKIASRGYQVEKHHSYWIPKGDGEISRGHIYSLDNIIENMLTQEDKINCLFIYNDVAASYVIQNLRRNSVNIPEDIAVASFDNTIISQMMNITSIAQPINEMGKIAFELINNMERSEHIDSIALTTKLIVRESSLSITVTTVN